jgi:hypothetical protein
VPHLPEGSRVAKVGANDPTAPDEAIKTLPGIHIFQAKHHIAATNDYLAVSGDIT